jgi:hypothetical protein
LVQLLSDEAIPQYRRGQILAVFDFKNEGNANTINGSATKYNDNAHSKRERATKDEKEETKARRLYDVLDNRLRFLLIHHLQGISMMTYDEARKYIMKSATRIYPSGFELYGWIQNVEQIDNEVYFIFAGFGKWRIHQKYLRFEGKQLIFSEIEVKEEVPVKVLKVGQLQLF